MHKDISSIIGHMTLHQKVMLVTGKNSWRTQAFEDLGIPSILVSDGTSGVRFQKGSDEPAKMSFYELLEGSFDSEEALANTVVSTCYPSGSAIACSWDRQMIRRIGKALAGDCKKLGINMLLGPGMNIHRHPLTARNFEYYAEDPVLTGEMAAAIVSAVQAEGVGTCMKHFACHNSDTRRTRVNVHVSERALREIYLAGYERVIEKAGPTAMMSAYNKVNGEEASGDNRLTRDIVKGEWGFDGAIFCDWGAIKDPVAATMGAIDLQMPLSKSSAAYLEKAVNEGKIPEALLDARVERILKLVFKLKDWEASWIAGDMESEADKHKLAQDAAAESMVLLRNEHDILPLGHLTGKNVAVIGAMAKVPLYQGTGCAIVHTENVDIPYECLLPYLDGATIAYAEGYHPDGSSDETLLEAAEAASRDADVCLLFVGCYLPREDDDYNRKSIRLSGGMEKLIDRVTAVNKNTVVLLAGGEVCEMPWREQTAALLLTWFSGEGMGQAAADILFGKVSPSGRLANTVPVSLRMTPAYLSCEGNIYEIPYTEDIYVGYRWYDKREIRPAYPFGFGLSYCTFSCGNPVISQTENGWHIEVNVTNTGRMIAAQVVQLYIRPDHQTALPRPLRELKGFERILLAPGETGSVSFDLTDRDFAYYDPELCGWLVEQGSYIVEIAESSRDIVREIPVKMADSFVISSNGSRRPVQRPVRQDAGFYELFADPQVKEKFYGYLVEKGLVSREQVGEKLERSLLGSFWAVSAYLDMNSDGMIDLEDFLGWLRTL